MGGAIISRGLIGIASGSDARKQNGYCEVENVFVNLLTDENRWFLSRAVKKGFDIPATCCECERVYRQEKSFSTDPKITTVTSYEIEVGDYNNRKLCEKLNSTSYYVDENDEYFSSEEKRYYQMQKCTRVDFTQCKS